MSDFEKKVLEFKNKLDQTQDVKLVESIRSEIFGKNGFINQEFKRIGTLSSDEKKNFASSINKANQELQDIIRSKLLWNNEAPQNAMIKDANPLESLAWVSNLLISLGRTIPKDSIIITGSVIKTRAPNKGDHIIYKIEDLSEVEIKVI